MWENLRVLDWARVNLNNKSGLDQNKFYSGSKKEESSVSDTVQDAKRVPLSGGGTTGDTGAK